MAINVFTASGNIGRDCELRVTPNGKSIAAFPLPVKQGYGEHEKTSWVQCKLFGNQAEKLSQYLTKGVKVVVTGGFVMDEWTDKESNKRSTATVLVNSLEFASQSNGGQAQQPQQQSVSQQSGGHQSSGSQIAPAQPQRQPAPAGYQGPQAQQQMQPPADFDDGIPF